jgi:nucleoside-diphosphate-sugar epimerase
MKTLITGAAGFIGHNVIDMLKQRNVDCFGIDTRTDYGFIPKKELSYLMSGRTKKSNYSPLVIDICDEEKIKSYIGTFDIKCIVHLASFPRQKVVAQNPALASQVMTTGLINLLEAASIFKVKRFVYISSSMVYGDFESGVTEDAVCNPQGQYGIMKYMGEKLVEDYARRTGMEYVIIRPSAVYGEWDVDDRVVSKFALSALRGQELVVKGANERLDFTHVLDTAQGIVDATLSKNTKNKIYNITRSNPNTPTLAEAADLIVQLAGSGSIRMADRDTSFPSRGRLSIDRAQNDFGFNPTIDVEDGFQRYLNWLDSSIYWKSILNGK